MGIRSFVTPAVAALLLICGCAPSPEGITLRQEPRVAMWTVMNSHRSAFYTAEWCSGEGRDDPACRDRLWSWTPELCREGATTPTCEEWRARSDEIATRARERAGDLWAIGQGVFTMTREGRFDVADELATACRAEPWWCMMLRGHVMYERGDALAAEAVLDSAVSAAPHPEACAWSDLTWVLDGDAVAPYDASDCTERWRRLDPVWLLADPAWTREGNEARAAWLGRMAWAELHDDYEERGFERVGGQVTDGRGHSIEHHREVLRGDSVAVRQEYAWRTVEPRIADFAAFPASSAVANPLSIRDRDWDFRGAEQDFRVSFEDGPVRPLPNQVALFERGDSVLVVAVAEPFRSPFESDAPSDSVVLVLASPSEGVLNMTPMTEIGLGRPLLAEAPRGPYLVGLEGRTGSGFSRSRTGHRLPSEADASLRASDLLLFRPGADFSTQEVDELEHVLDRARGSSSWQVGDVVGVFGEIYGPSTMSDVEVTFSLERLEEPGLLRQIGEAVGIVQTRGPLEISWSEPAGEFFAGAWTLNLSEAEPGPHRITLSAMIVVGGEQVKAVTSREFDVLPRSPGR